ncbi:MAG: hypothetical protein MUC49_01175 [Raineya sp.]|jgi:hypothetical protein|nr:hypothetical protein [Raineya sp.]
MKKYFLFIPVIVLLFSYNKVAAQKYGLMVFIDEKVVQESKISVSVPIQKYTMKAFQINSKDVILIEEGIVNIERGGRTIATLSGSKGKISSFSSNFALQAGDKLTFIALKIKQNGKTKETYASKAIEII